MTTTTHTVGSLEIDARIIALANHLESTKEEREAITETEDGQSIYTTSEGDYRVLNDAEADMAAFDSIYESVQYFNASFLAEYCELPESVFTSIQKDERNADEAILSLIKRMPDGMQGFVDEAISADGRGHFIAQYDFDENEETVEGVTYFIYRVN